MTVRLVNAAERVQGAANGERRTSESMVQRKPHVRLHKANARADLGEIGTYGLRQYGGYVIEEWLRSLQGSKRAWAYREMMDNDPVIGAILYAIRMLTRKATWTVKEGKEPEAAEFIDSCREDMSHTWGDFVSEALSMLGYGWNLCEIVYKRRLGPQPDSSPKPSSAFNDGRIGWRKLPSRAQETLMKWQFDPDDDGLVAFEQLDYHGQHNIIPIEKALLFRTRKDRNNPEGMSILRSAYVPWFRLKNIQEIEAIGIERDLAGIPVATPPEGVDLNSPANAALLLAYQELVTSIRRDEDEGVVMPQAGAKLELLTTGGSRQIDTDAIVRRYEQRIASSMLADFILIGQDAVGSFAMVDVKADLFGIALDAILDIVCEVMNRYAIPRLLALNGMDVSEPPKITHSSTGRINLQTVGTFLNQMQLAGAPIPWSEDLIEALFKSAGLPVDFKADAAQPLKDPQDATKPEPPASPPGTRPDAVKPADDVNANQPSKTPDLSAALSKADVQTGAMVALYPSASVARQLAQDGGEAPGDLHVTLAFLGDAASLGDETRLRRVVSGFAATCPPLEGVVSGTGKFTAGASPVSYASVDVPGLPDVRERLVDALRRAGFPPAADHGFTPHLTLAYDDRDPEIANHPLAFDRITLALAGTKSSYQLGGKVVHKDDRDLTQWADTPASRQVTLKAQSLVPNEHGALPISPILRQRAKLLQAQYETDVKRALGQLGDMAHRAYLGTVQKATTTTDASAATLAQRVMSRLNVNGWLQTVLQPVIQGHSQRVMQDTLQTLNQQIGLAVNIPDPDQARIIAAGGTNLGLADIEPDVRQAIMQAIADGRDQGLGANDIAQRIRMDVPAGRFTQAGSGYRAKLISRTESLDAQRATALAAYQAAPNVSAVQVSDGILEDSDSDCIDRDGLIVSIDQADTITANHPLCTLSLDPIISAPGDITGE